MTLFAAVYTWCEHAYLDRTTPPIRWPLVLISATIAPLQALGAFLGGDTFLWRGQHIRLHRGGHFDILPTLQEVPTSRRSPTRSRPLMTALLLLHHHHRPHLAHRLAPIAGCPLFPPREKPPHPLATEPPCLVSILQPILSGDPTLPHTLGHNVAARTMYAREFIWLVDEDDAAGQRSALP